MAVKTLCFQCQKEIARQPSPIGELRDRVHIAGPCQGCRQRFQLEFPPIVKPGGLIELNRNSDRKNHPERSIHLAGQ